MIHLVGLPHTSFDSDRFSSCAFTAKSVRFARILTLIERDAVIYWGGNSTPYLGPHEFVSCLSEEEQEAFFGRYDQNALPVIHWDLNLPYWRVFHERAITAIRERIQPGDYVALVGGAISQEVVNEFSSQVTCIEPGVGYEGICRGTHACFESYAWMHHRYGAYGINDGRAFDTVIPNFFDPQQFTISPPGDYLLFVGRFIARKGPHVAADIAERLGVKIKMAGAGVAHQEPGLLITTDGTRITGDHVEYVGSVTPDQRRPLMSQARAMLVPTLYIGPFEGVHAESLLSGVMPVAPDYGVFTETLPREFRYRSMKEALRATERAMSIVDRTERLDIRQQAMERFSIDACARSYERWFAQLDTLRGDGWYAV